MTIVAVPSHPLEKVDTEATEITLSGFEGAARPLTAVRFSADPTPTCIFAFGDEQETTYVLRGEGKAGLIWYRIIKQKGHGERHEYLSNEGCWKVHTDLTHEPPDALRFGPTKG
jgi:hypothetical protein